jgi:perosamine synthetase
MEDGMDKDNLAYYGGEPTIDPADIVTGWPEITQTYQSVVKRQLDTTISIYNRSGVIEEFENEFATLHGAKYALLNNSGTNAIWAMIVGAGLGPGDEIICPTYTFFATNTPLLSSGVTPVFCDADENGNINPLQIEKLITNKTKAILITHMWGYPCDMDKIVAVARNNNLLLFEDCSHAHLATYKNRVVGSFGDAAAWSLQGQKNITGGEGGILITNDQEIYIRANLLGHYNKRCKDEIPSDHPLYKFATTGMGLKHRAHPLAVAFALQQLRDAPIYQERRNDCASRYQGLLKNYDFIDLQTIKAMQPSWYAYVFKFNHASITREEFVAMLHKEGLTEVDIPGSTGPNHTLPIFKEPCVLFPQFYAKGTHFNTDTGFPNAEQFYASIIKLPVWANSEASTATDAYIKGLKKVLDYVAQC